VAWAAESADRAPALMLTSGGGERTRSGAALLVTGGGLRGGGGLAGWRGGLRGGRAVQVQVVEGSVASACCWEPALVGAGPKSSWRMACRQCGQRTSAAWAAAWAALGSMAGAAGVAGCAAQGGRFAPAPKGSHRPLVGAT
jgi:hypothetical protein